MRSGLKDSEQKFGAPPADRSEPASRWRIKRSRSTAGAHHTDPVCKMLSTIPSARTNEVSIVMMNALALTQLMRN